MTTHSLWSVWKVSPPTVIRVLRTLYPGPPSRLVRTPVGGGACTHFVPWGGGGGGHAHTLYPGGGGACTHLVPWGGGGGGGGGACLVH